MSDITKYLKRAIDERPKGGMQTGIPKITMREADAVRLLHEINHLESQLQAAKIEAVRNVRKCERISDQSVTLTFSSCRAASEFERYIEQLKEQGV